MPIIACAAPAATWRWTNSATLSPVRPGRVRRRIPGTRHQTPATGPIPPVFDYAVGGSALHLSVFDAMGHDTTAGMTATLAVATSRNARRQRASLIETSQAIEDC
ncbi:hypothetical protein [Streptomyces sp. MUSC 14]|uniref:hypothetical protein n=1 Tax=Streptomyces sp. MUSC 14 TaxID=1354889 RepID=UPI000B31E54C